jgi:hypothetical protein
MDTQQTDKPTSPTLLHERVLARALTFDEIVAEARRRVELFRRAPRGDNPAKADALESFLHWLEAIR